jgi:Cell differentiation family, Rcd1-like
VSIYPLLSPPSLTAHASNRVCNALALLQCVASHQETRSLFLRGGQQVSDALTEKSALRILRQAAHDPRLTGGPALAPQRTCRCSCTPS